MAQDLDEMMQKAPTLTLDHSEKRRRRWQRRNRSHL